MKNVIGITLLFLSFSSILFAQDIADQYAPEMGNADVHKNRKPGISILAKDFIVASAHPLATKAAFDVLAAGGNAIDAMVTVQSVLGLVEPQSSGLGGGAFLVYYDAKAKQVRTFDGRETAPLKAGEELFLDDDKQAMAFFEAVVGGRSVGTPGTVKLLSEVHAELGSLNWETLLKPAIELAEDGFEVGARLANALKRDEQRLKQDPTAYAYFFPNGEAIKPGERLSNTEYAKTLRLLAKHGGNYFYDSEISTAIVDKVTNASKPGFLDLKDFSSYKIIERQAICTPYHRYEICGMGPPSSGAITVSQTLGLLTPFKLSARPANSAETWQLIADASRLAFADRGLYIADTDFIDMPKGLLDSSYLKRRAKLITPGKALAEAVPGNPDPDFVMAHEAATSIEAPSTSHFVIVDKDKNIVSMTSTIENGFGSRLMVKGFLLNNELTDFSFKPSKSGLPVANRVQPGKRPRSSMAPTIVLKDKAPYLALGSPGGSRIINYVTNSLIAVLDWNKTPQEAFDLPHIVNRFGTMDIEEGSHATSYEQSFKEMGFDTSIRNLNSGLHGVLFTQQGMLGGADKRREGTVMGR